MPRPYSETEVVIPMDRILVGGWIPVTLPFRVKNIGNQQMRVRASMSGLSGGFSNYDVGWIGAGQEKDVVFDDVLRRGSKPATDTEEEATLTLEYYIKGFDSSDPDKERLVNWEKVRYKLVYVDFNDDSYEVVDEDTFEEDLEGWTKVDVNGDTSVQRSSEHAELSTGQWAMRHFDIGPGDEAFLSKNFTIGDVEKAYIRVCVWGLWDCDDARFLLELITDAGNVSKRRVVPIPLTSRNKVGRPPGGDPRGSWSYFGAKLPVNGTYEVRLRVKGITGNVELWYDDIKVVQK